MMRQYDLVERVRRYNPNSNEALLNRAYVYAMKAHGEQRRASGDPYFSHPLEVAAREQCEPRDIIEVDDRRQRLVDEQPRRCDGLGGRGADVEVDVGDLPRVVVIEHDRR